MRMKPVLFLVLLGISVTAGAQDPIEVRYGFVVGKERLKEGNPVPKGAIIGGLVGLATAGGKSGSTKVKRTAGGALLGGLIANEVGKSNEQWLYTVRFPGGGEAQIVMDDNRLSMGDCAAVEEGYDQTRVHYASDYFCRARPLGELSGDEEDPCLEAKRRLLEEEDPEQIEVLERKVKLICGEY